MNIDFYCFMKLKYIQYIIGKILPTVLGYAFSQFYNPRNLVSVIVPGGVFNWSPVMLSYTIKEK
ncbi:hypothetical protein C2G38_2114676 [Gigaspora rosea]|uniref:Uncharacterized protein n=1 Tax=Gigaspora rosea TaxID=44941 RepID=A0A397UA95_9GLOM|nr:hypothetical protein C2G38_2114676 [Gigaspora rosea]